MRKRERGGEREDRRGEREEGREERREERGEAPCVLVKSGYKIRDGTLPFLKALERPARALEPKN